MFYEYNLRSTMYEIIAIQIPVLLLSDYNTAFSSLRETSLRQIFHYFYKVSWPTVHHQYLVGRDAEVSGAETQPLGHILMHSELAPSFSLLSLWSPYEVTLMVFLPLPSSQLWILQQTQILKVLKILYIVTEFVRGMFICVACFVCS